MTSRAHIALMTGVTLALAASACKQSSAPPSDRAPIVEKSVQLPTTLRLSYVDVGDPSAQHVLVLLPGMSDSWRSWEPVLPHLPTSIRVIAISQRGHGDSDKPDAGYSVDDYAKDLEAVLDALGVARVVVAGHSSASLVARRFALQHRSRVVGVILEASFVRLGGSAAAAAGPRFAALADPIDPAFVRDFVAGTIARSVDKAFADSMIAESLKVPARVWRETFRSLLDYDDSGELASFTAPTLIVRGDHDAIIDRSASDELAHAIRSAKVTTYEGVGHTPHWEAPEKLARDIAAFVTEPKVPLFDGIGEHKRKVTTESVEAQRYFDQGLNFVANFNHDEAIRSFAAAADLDPECAMAHWGVAYASGPHYNLPMVTPEKAAAAWAALGRARNAKGKTPLEQKLIEALATRHAEKEPEDRKPLDAAYAAAMRKVWSEAPDDADVGAMFAESLMNLRPWALYQPDGSPQPETVEVVQTLEAVLAKEPRHPFALHLLIHALEMSPTPEKADLAATTLRSLTPGLGHLVHMPSHIDIRLGRWAQAIQTNVDAMTADKKYREQVPEQGFYRIYMAHNPHMRAFAAMMSGRKEEAIAVMDQAVADIPTDWATQWAPFIDGFMAMPLEVRMRFGAWDEILAAPELPEHFPMSRAMRHYVRAAALGAKGQLPEARAEQKLFIAGREKVAKDAAFGNNAAADLFAVADKLLEGELLVHEKKGKKAIAALTAGVALEDKLRYDEPPDWIQPVRHTLGAALLQQKNWKEAEAVFRADLRKLPNNGWALSGLARALEAQKKPEAKIIAALLAEVWVPGETPPATSCLCLQSQ